jgi:hypothetical protein
MSVILTHISEICGQELEIVVNFNIKEFEVEDIREVYVTGSPLNQLGQSTLPVWSLFKEIPEMEVAIDKIVQRVDWRELYAETRNQ